MYLVRLVQVRKVPRLWRQHHLGDHDHVHGHVRLSFLALHGLHVLDPVSKMRKR
jgi:hypothetical protein